MTKTKTKTKTETYELVAASGRVISRHKTVLAALRAQKKPANYYVYTHIRRAA